MDEGSSLADEHERIWLAPKCQDSGSEGRLWCQDRLPDCDEIGCENPSVEYVRAYIADTRSERAEAEARAEVEREIVDAAVGALQWLEQLADRFEGEWPNTSKHCRLHINTLRQALGDHRSNDQ